MAEPLEPDRCICVWPLADVDDRDPRCPIHAECPGCGAEHDMRPCRAEAAECDCCRSILAEVG